jgi:GTPase SAR1 family protein
METENRQPQKPKIFSNPLKGIIRTPPINVRKMFKHYANHAVNGMDCLSCQNNMTDDEFVDWLKAGGAVKCMKFCVQPFLMAKNYQAIYTAERMGIVVKHEDIRTGRIAFDRLFDEIVGTIQKRIDKKASELEQEEEQA